MGGFSGVSAASPAYPLPALRYAVTTYLRYSVCMTNGVWLFATRIDACTGALFSRCPLA